MTGATCHGVHRGVYGSLFDDPDYQMLSSSARLTLLTIRLCAQAGPAAIFRYYPEVLARQTGLEPKRVISALAELASTPRHDSPWIVYDEAIVWVRNGLRHDPTIRFSNPKHARAVARAVAGLPHREIVLNFCDYYNLAKPFDSLSNAETALALRIPNTEVLPNTEIQPSADAKRSSVLTDAQFVLSLRSNPAYCGFDLDAEFAKIDAWLLANPRRKKTRRFIVNWLNRVERPLPAGQKPGAGYVNL